MVHKALVWTEPHLTFKPGIQESIIDPKVGLALHGPLDSNTRRRRFARVRIGLIAKDVDRVVGHLAKLNETYPAQKVGDLPYQGFEKTYGIPLVLPAKSDVVHIDQDELAGALKEPGALQNIARLYEAKIQEFHDRMRGNYDVLCVQIPDELVTYDSPTGPENLRDLIKASAIRGQIVTQVLTQRTLSSKYECDNMWNLSVGMYTKAGGVPWKLEDFSSTKSFIGIAYGIKRTEKEQTVFSGLAHIFDQFGEHVSMTSITSEAYGEDFVLAMDGNYHLSQEKIELLLRRLVEDYKRKIGTPPDKVVVHKTSFFNDEEKRGVNNALSEVGGSYNLVHLLDNSSQRLLSDERKAPMRGTFWMIDDVSALLYTTGYVQAFNTYPGIATPKPIEVRLDGGSSKLNALGKEVFALTKMDWNNATFMNREPVTTKYATRIVEIVKAGLQPDELVKDIRYYI